MRAARLMDVRNFSLVQVISQAVLWTRRFLFTQGHPFWGKEFHGQSQFLGVICCLPSNSGIGASLLRKCRPLRRWVGKELRLSEHISPS